MHLFHHIHLSCLTLVHACKVDICPGSNCLELYGSSVPLSRKGAFFDFDLPVLLPYPMWTSVHDRGDLLSPSRKGWMIATKIFLLALLVSMPAHAFRVEVKPRQVRPGDPFSVTACEAPGVRDIRAAFGAASFSFHPFEKGCVRAIVAVNLDVPPGVHAVRVEAGEEVRELEVSVLSGEFPTIELSLPEGKVSLSDENLRRVEEETRLLASLWTANSDPLWGGRFILPLTNELSTAFGVRRIMNKKHVSIHRGIDIRGKEGEKVQASNRGRVVLVRELFFGGNTVVLDHGAGVFTVYMHLSAFAVAPGEIVDKGSVIGYVGATGRASGPHLHFGAKVRDISVNPVSLIDLDL